MRYVKLFEEFNSNGVDKASIKQLNDKLKALAIESSEKAGGHLIEISGEAERMVSNAPYNMVKTLTEYLCNYIKSKDSGMYSDKMRCDMDIADSLNDSSGYIGNERSMARSEIESDCFRIEVYDDYDIDFASSGFSYSGMRENPTRPTRVYVKFLGSGPYDSMQGKTIIDLETGKEIPGKGYTTGELCQLKDLTSDYRLNQKPGFSIIKWNDELLERLIKNIDQSPY